MISFLRQWWGERQAYPYGHKRPSLALGTYSAGQEAKRLQADVREVTYGKRVDRLVSERIVELLD